MHCDEEIFPCHFLNFHVREAFKKKTISNLNQSQHIEQVEELEVEFEDFYGRVSFEAGPANVLLVPCLSLMMIKVKLVNITQEAGRT